MSFGNFFSDNDDIQFQLQKRIDAEALWAWLSEEEKEVVSATTPDEYIKNWSEVLESYGQICSELVAPNAEKVEHEHLKLEDGQVVIPPAMTENMNALKEFGVGALAVSVEYGGMACPYFFEMIGGELLNRACPSTALNAGWYGSIANILEQFAPESIKEEYLPKIAESAWSGNMALTEPGAGSDLSAIRTYAEKQEDGSYRLFGNKIFISNGNSQIALVLAMGRKGADKLTDLSLFLCPRRVDDKVNFAVTKLEEKVGLHGSATCAQQYENSKAWIIGKEGEGFRQMLKLMNDARIAVGYQAVGLMEASLKIAKDHAEERVTWGKPIKQHELVAEMLLDREAELKAFRSLCYQASFNRSLASAGEKFMKRNDLSSEEKNEVKAKVAIHQRRVRRWTPLIKWWGGEKSVVHARSAMQVLGGYGFTKEYRAEWWVRESLIYSLYEGTSQIQSLMCMKDTLKEVVRAPMDFTQVALGYKIKGISETDALKKKLYRLKQITHSAVISVLFKLVKKNVADSLSQTDNTDIMKIIKILSKDLVKFENLRPALLHAERITEMKSYLALAEVATWDAEEDESRRWVAERILYRAIPLAQALKAMIDTEEETIDSVLDSYETSTEE